MSGKPQVFKMGGSWVWQCHEHAAGQRFGEDFPVESWRQAWDVCLGAATRHVVAYHAEPAELIEP